ncbi:MAG: DDE-type integrase/transposase/recombinase, partial [Pontiella sp.]
MIDWYSRYILSWELSNTMESLFFVDALEHALTQGTPDIFNTDQGSPFTSNAFTGVLLDGKIRKGL